MLWRATAKDSMRFLLTTNGAFAFGLLTGMPVMSRFVTIIEMRSDGFYEYSKYNRYEA
jgi:hypothetical protein